MTNESTKPPRDWRQELEGAVTLLSLKTILAHACRSPAAIEYIESIKRHWKSYNERDRRRLHWVTQGYVHEYLCLIEELRHQIFVDNRKINELKRSLVTIQELSTWMEDKGYYRA